MFFCVLARRTWQWQLTKLFATFAPKLPSKRPGTTPPPTPTPPSPPTPPTPPSPPTPHTQTSAPEARRSAWCVGCAAAGAARCAAWICTGPSWKALGSREIGSRESRENQEETSHVWFTGTRSLHPHEATLPKIIIEQLRVWQAIFPDALPPMKMKPVLFFLLKVSPVRFHVGW